MKKNLLSAVFLITILCLNNFSFAQTASSVTVIPVTANYSANPPTVTFEVSWPANSRNANHRAKVWVFVDYRRIQNNAYIGGWLRAGISSAHTPVTNNGAVSLETGNVKGFWLEGPNDALAFAATVTVPVTVDLTGYAPQFSWCGVASDRPPTAIEHDGYYALHGTKDFIIQTHPTDASQTITRSTAAYDNCIYSLTDSTGAPGEVPAMPEIIDFTASTTTICAGQDVTLTATATAAASYSFNDGAWQVANTKTVSPSASTTYTLKVRSAGGCTVSATTTVTITVNDPPTNLSLTANPDVICSGQPATLTASADNAASYSLTRNGSDWTTATTFEVTPQTTKTYDLYVQSADGCIGSLANAATVTVNNPPTGLSLTSATICNGESATLTAAPAGAASYSLDNNNWQTAATFEVMSTATKTYDLYVQSADGCIGTLTNAATVTVNNPPTGLSLTSVIVCNGDAATLTATPAGAASYSLTGNGSDWQAANTFVVTPNTTKTYDLYVQSTDGYIGSLANAATVTVHPVFSPGEITTASGTATAGTDTGITIASATDASGGDGNITYQWRRSGTSSATLSYNSSTYPLNNSTADYSTDGTYCFKRYARDGLCNTVWTASAGQYTLTVVASCSPCTTWTYCSSFTEISSVSAETGAKMNWHAAASYCQTKATGWRLPYLSEAQCACGHRDEQPGLYINGFYWVTDVRTTYQTSHYTFAWATCGASQNSDSFGYYVKCVK